VLGHYTLAGSDQVMQQVEDLGLDSDHLGAATQFPPLRIERVIFKDVDHAPASASAGKSGKSQGNAKGISRTSVAPALRLRVSSDGRARCGSSREKVMVATCRCALRLLLMSWAILCVPSLPALADCGRTSVRIVGTLEEQVSACQALDEVLGYFRANA